MPVTLAGGARAGGGGGGERGGTTGTDTVRCRVAVQSSRYLSCRSPCIGRQKLVVVAILTIFLAGMFALSQFVAGVWERPSPPHHTPRAGDRGQVDMWGDAASEDASNATAAKQELDRLTHNQSASLISIIEDKLKHDIRNGKADARARARTYLCTSLCAGVGVHVIPLDF